MADPRFLRNKDIIDQKLLTEALIVGAGGIGSELVVQLAIMGFKSLTVYDFDILEKHNLSSTKYPEKFLGVAKVIAAKESAIMYNSNCTVIENNRAFDETCTALPITIVCTDSMKSRKIVYRKWKELDNRKLFIDVRMSALTMQMVTVTKEHDAYEDKYWFSDKEVEPLPCTAKHTIFTANLAAGNTVKNVFLVLMGHGFWAYEWTTFSPSYFEGKDWMEE